MAYITVFPKYNAVYDGLYLGSWDDVLKRLEATVVLPNSHADLVELKKTDGKAALAVKFRNGGYDAGPCPVVRNPKTGDEKPCRAKGVPGPSEYNVIVLDADDNTENFDEKLKSAMGGYRYYAHSTISSTNEKPRRRVLFPLAKPVNPDTREAFVRFIADKVGMDAIDQKCKSNKQMQCFPVYTSDGERYKFYNDVPTLLDETFLPEGWNASTWPMWPNEEADVVKHSKRPRTVFEETGSWVPVTDKNKVHNAFNATYRISDILSKHGYKHTDTYRWSHAGGTTDGIKVTNDSILYSYYANDRLSVERDLDAYETALILEYGDITNKGNWGKMQAEAARDPEVLKTMRNSLSVTLPEDAESWAALYDTTEEGLAQRCMLMFPHKIRNGKWWRYQGGIYRRVNDAAMLPDALQIIRITAALQPDDESIQDMVGKVNVARNVLKAWQGMATLAEPTEWEEKPWYLHFTDCVIDLKAWCAGEDYILEHNPDMMLTESVGYAWKDVENVNHDALDAVIKNMEIYLPDEDIRGYFQKALGRCLTAAAAAEDKCIWLMGPEGGNGKSTILNAVKGALGSYYYEMQGKYLYYSNKERDAEAPSPELAGMRDKRYVNFCEYNGIRTLDGEKYKNYASAGFIKARFLGSDNDSFQAKCCCSVDCNGMPGLQRKENAILRRTRVIPFLAKLSGDAAVKNSWMKDKNIHVAMLVWMLLGLKAWYDNGCKLDNGITDETIPADVYTETMAWINSFDDPADFFDDFYEITHNDDDYLIADECFEVYQQQVYDRGATRHAFRQAEERWLRQHGITHKAKRVVADGLRRMCYTGVRLRVSNNYGSFGKWQHIVEVKDEPEEPPKKVEKAETFVLGF